MKIIIAREVPESTLAKIKEFIAEEAKTEPRLNGVKYRIERGDYTSIPEDDSDEANRLFISIRNIILEN